MNVAETLTKAAEDATTVTFAYNGEQRVLEVELVTISGESEFVTGYDKNREAIRRFTLSKIENLEVI